MSREVHGWAFYEKEHIDAKNAKNIHIFSGTIIYNNDGSIKFRAEDNAECGQSKKKPAIYLEVANTKDTVRSKAVLIENTKNGKTLCGSCVSHFYADPED